MITYTHKPKAMLLCLLVAMVFSTSCSANTKSGGVDVTPSNPVTVDPFTITWETNIPSEKKTTTVNYGDTPVAGFTPASYEENGYQYTFKEWSPSIEVATKNTTYKALYNHSQKEYTVKFVDSDDTEISSKTYKYGLYPEIPANPSKTGYSFACWEPSVTAVTKDTIYKATYKANQTSISVDCTGCSIDGRTKFTVLSSVGTEVTYHFALSTSRTYVDYPLNIDFLVDGAPSSEYRYDKQTGNLMFVVTGNVSITAKADDYTIKMIYQYDSEKTKVQFGYSGTLTAVDWGDETKDTNTSHEYSSSSNEQFVIKIYGDITSFYLSDNYVDTLSSGNRKLDNISIYRGINTICNFAFAFCDSLSAIRVPNDIVSIGSFAFYRCTSMASFSIPEGVKSIGSSAFESCSSLSSVNIPNSVTAIGDRAFAVCDALHYTDYYFASYLGNASNPYLYLAKMADTPADAWIHNKCKIICSGAFTGYTGEYVEYNNGYYLKSHEYLYTAFVKPIDDTVSEFSIAPFCKFILGYAFDGCSSLTSIEIPNSVTSIGDFAFLFCESLSSITISSSVTSIGDYSFSNCHLLSSINLPDSLVSIGEGAFTQCDSLTSIVIPKNVWFIGNRLFVNCTSLTSIKVDTANAIYDSRDNCNAIIETATNCLFFGCASSTIPNSITSIESDAFTEFSIFTSIFIPNSVISIGANSFASCRSLQSVTFEEGSHLTTIYYSAFQYCSSLTSIIIPNSVTSIGDYAFESCSHLNTVSFEDDCQLASISPFTFGYCSRLSTIVIPNKVTSIGQSAFIMCKALLSVTIPNSVTSIGASAFMGCSILDTVDMTRLDHVIEGSDDMFLLHPENLKIKIPNYLLRDYRNAPYWIDYHMYFVPIEPSNLIN